jgi:phosphotriesterase-related protein
MFIQTTSGPVPIEQVGIILPHEHLFTDLRGPLAPSYATAELNDVSRVMTPLLEDARKQGIGVLVECSSVGVGRNVNLCAQLADASGVQVVVPTGVYCRDAYAPAEYVDMTETDLTMWMIHELSDGIDGTGIRAGFIKLACDDEPLSPFQKRLHQAAATASLCTGAALAVHIPSGERALELADLYSAVGMPLNRFIWVHAQSESDLALHVELAQRGVYVEYDSVGGDPADNQQLIRNIAVLCSEKCFDNILLSQDAGWYQPGEWSGGTQKPYTHLTNCFIPALLSAGIPEPFIRKLTRDNPFNALAMPIAD